MYIFSYHYPLSEVSERFRWLTNCICVGCFATGGTACRWALSHLADELRLISTDDTSLGNVIFPELISNILGSFIIGLFVARKERIVKRWPAIYVGITTGFCGCLTTFSSWISCSGHFFAYGYIGRGVMTLIVGMACSYTACDVGHSIGSWLSDQTRPKSRQDPVVRVEMANMDPSKTSTRNSSRSSTEDNTDPKRAKNVSNHQTEFLLAIASAVILLVTFLALFTLAALEDRKNQSVLFLGLLLSPPFALIRYAMGFRNKLHPEFPLYTLFANALGTLLSVICGGLVSADSVNPSRGTTIVLEAIVLGAAGSLSTVSSFVNEVRQLKPPLGIRYTSITLLFGLILAIPIKLIFRSDNGEI